MLAWLIDTGTGRLVLVGLAVAILVAGAKSSSVAWCWAPAR